jgi:hypothetical protein
MFRCDIARLSITAPRAAPRGEQAQPLLAKATGSFKRGNERRTG